MEDRRLFHQLADDGQRDVEVERLKLQGTASRGGPGDDGKDSVFYCRPPGMVGSVNCTGARWPWVSDKLIVRTSKELICATTRVAAFCGGQTLSMSSLAAAKVGGILANSTPPAEFIYDNLAIQTNVIHQAYLHGGKKLPCWVLPCIYPRDSPQPMKEEYLLTGSLETDQ